MLDVIEEEKLCARANAIGKIILDRCNALKDRSNLNCVGDVRGLGAMCAIELVKDSRAPSRPRKLTQALMKVANEKGLILLSCGTYGNVIRFLVPLTASDDIVRDGMDIFEASLTEAVTRVGVSSHTTAPTQLRHRHERKARHQRSRSILDAVHGEPPI